MDFLRQGKNFGKYSPGGTPNGLHKIIDTTGHFKGGIWGRFSREATMGFRVDF
jgi:hypothetical protein